MAFKTGDKLQETTTTAGTGTVTLAGATIGNRPLSVKFNNGDVGFVVIDNGTGVWEAGLVTWNTGGTLTRSAGNVVDGSSGPGTLVSLTGTSTVTVSPLAEKLMQMTDAGVYRLDKPLDTTVDGDTGYFSQDASIFRFGSWSTQSGDIYNLAGDQVMWYWSHNVAINPANGNFMGADDTGPCTVWVITEGLGTNPSQWSRYDTPVITATVAPTVAQFTMSFTLGPQGLNIPVFAGQLYALQRGFALP